MIIISKGYTNMRNLQQNSFRKFHLERNCTILKMAKIDPKQPKFAQNKGTRGPNLTNNPSNSISKLSLIQWNNSFLNLNTHKNRVCKGPPFDFHPSPKYAKRYLFHPRKVAVAICFINGKGLWSQKNIWELLTKKVVLSSTITWPIWSPRRLISYSMLEIV